MVSRAVLYSRISEDRRGLSLGIERQREDCEALAERLGCDVVDRFSDNDISAYSGKPRPGYTALLATIEAKAADVIIAWDPDRLHRSPLELEHFIAVVEAAGADVQTVQAGHWDLSTPAGRLIARQLGAVARYESEHKSQRVRRALQQNAQRGKSHGGPAYGWVRVPDPSGGWREQVDPASAAVVVNIAKRIIAGDSIRSITADLNAAGVAPPRGGSWGKPMVRHLVLRERNIGLRIHHREVVGEGDWPPVMSRALYDQVRAVLSDPARRTSQSSAAAHLLSGIATCGVCGGVVRAGLNRGSPSYRCADRSCVSRRREDVDDLVTDLMVGYLGRPDALALLNSPHDGSRQEALDEAQVLRARLDGAADDYADGKIDGQQMERISGRLRPALEAAQARAQVIDQSAVFAGIAGSEQAEALWQGWPLSRRRAALQALMKVRILPAARGIRRFAPESVEITWRREDTSEER